MARSILWLICWLVLGSWSFADEKPQAAAPTKKPNGNRLTYLDEPCNPYYVHKDFPKLTTPMWVGEEGVDAVVVLAIDDMRDPAKYEAYLRPILNRLKQIDGRAPVNIMTNNVKPDDPQLQSWLAEGLSFDVHTIDHPCPLLKDGDLAKAKSTYDRCVDLLASIPGNKPVAFRMPCCDSLNTVSPRFFTEIFNQTTPLAPAGGEGSGVRGDAKLAGRFLQIDSSVFNVFTSDDKTIPRELVLDADGKERFEQYIPSNVPGRPERHANFVNTIENYPYPYVIDRMCWEFPCVTPSDWSAQFRQKPNNPKTVEDWKAALDITVLKQGVFCLVFHPHNWIKPEQVVELIDHAVTRHGKKVKFLTFQDSLERLNKNVLGGVSLRDAKGHANGVRLLDVNNDGFLDATIGNAETQITKVWQPSSSSFREFPFPAVYETDNSVIFGTSNPNSTTFMMSFGTKRGAWKWTNSWSETDDFKVFWEEGMSSAVMKSGRRPRMIDCYQNGTTTLMWPSIYLDYEGQHPAPVRPDGIRDAGLRYIDLNGDGYLDQLRSSHQEYEIHLWDPKAIEFKAIVHSQRRGSKPAEQEPPPIVREDGSNNGFWVHSNQLVWMNEDTAKNPQLIETRSFDSLLAEHRKETARRERAKTEPLVPVGVATVDITPSYPTRMAGYGARVKEHESVAMPLHAKALVMGGKAVNAKRETASANVPLAPSGRGARGEGGSSAELSSQGSASPTPFCRGTRRDLLASAFSRSDKPDTDRFPAEAQRSQRPIIQLISLKSGQPDFQQGRFEASSNEHPLCELCASAGDQGAFEGCVGINLHPQTTKADDVRLKTELALQSPSPPTPLPEGARGDNQLPPHQLPLTVIVSIETCGIGEPLATKIADQLKEKYGIERERLVLSSTHTHSAPWLKDFGPNIFPPPLPDEHEKHLAQYETELIQKVIQVVGDAIEARRPARLSWAQTTANLNVNRRVLKDGKWTGFGNQADGPRDQRLPVITATDADGKQFAIWSNYPMHCTVHGGSFLQISGDWAGAAMEQIEADHPGATSLITIGCGADQGPRLNGGLAEARVLGREFADAVKSLLRTAERKPLDPHVDCKLIRIELPFTAVPTREQLETAAKKPGVEGSNAKHFLARLDAGESVPNTMTYPISTWTFGDDLAMVFLGGEVVVDYSLRLNREFDDSRLWITAYANDIPSYIASKRVLQEGGYEADFSMLYYRRPSRLAPEAEDLICDTVQKLLPHEFYSAEKQAMFPKPRSPEESLESIKVRPGLKVELVAAEPLIQDPVAFDWDTQGRLWVVEMSDYPNGVMSPEAKPHQNDELRGQPGGRIKILTDTNGDGRYDEAKTFMEGIAFPSGIQLWRDGVLVTAAPEIFFASDRDGDGRAEFKQTLYKGFVEGNQQHRVNGLRYGLDNWLYVGNGDSGGEVAVVNSLLPQSETSKTSAPIRGRDLRIRPDEGLLDAISGQTQFGRERNDWGDWFGNNNSRPIWHYALEDRYLRRNPHLAVRDTRVEIAEVPGAAPVFPQSKTMARFNDFDRANRFTSACSTSIYRDRYLGDEFYGNAFVCEPVHNLVSRLVLTSDGATFKARRAADEQNSEFLASSDNWFRPVMVRTGPDGAVWIADMYRAVIEHPRWIPPEWQRKLDLRAGSDRGRIYRVVRADSAPKPTCCSDSPAATGAAKDQTPVRPLAAGHLSNETLLAQLASPNGWWRDTAQRLLVERQDKTVVEPLNKMATEHAQPLARLHALCTLDGLHALTKPVVLKALNDRDAGVRRHAVRLSESWLHDGEVLKQLVPRVGDETPVVLQLAYSLGETRGDDETPGHLLAELALRHVNDSLISTAMLSSLHARNAEAVESDLARQLVRQGRQASPDLVSLLGRISAQSVALRNGQLSQQTLSSLLPRTEAEAEAVSPNALFPALRQLLGNAKADELERMAAVQPGWKLLLNRARQMAAAPQADNRDRIASMELLATAKPFNDDDFALIKGRLSPREPIEIQQAAVVALTGLGRADVPHMLLDNWRTLSPQVRQHVLDALLQRDATTLVLLDAFEKQQVSISDFDAVRRERLLVHKNSAIKDRAAKLFAASSTTTRQQVLDAFSNVLKMTGDTSRGRAVFDKRCSACHRLQDIGKQIGADLGAVKDRSAPALLTAILDPNRAVETRYFSYTIQTNDGRAFSGMLTSETGNSVTLVGADGKETVLLRADIDELASSNKSFMPEGLEKDLSPQDVADVIAFVQRSAPVPPLKQMPGNEPKLVKADADGSLRLLATNAELRGPTLVFEKQFQNLGYWQSADDEAAWTIEVPKPGKYTLSMTYAVEAGAAGDRFDVTIADKKLTHSAESTRTWENYQTVKLGEIELPAGKHRATMRAIAKPRSALLDLKELRLSP